MALLEKLLLPITVASGSMGSVIRDAFRNTTAKRRVLVCPSTTAGGTAVSAIDTLAGETSFRILDLSGDITDEDELGVTKVGQRYEVEDSAANNLAPIYYADAARTTFPTFWDCVIALLTHGEVLSEAEDTIGDAVGILIDQQHATPYASVVDAAVGNVATVGNTILLQFTPDPGASSDFAE